VKPLRSVTGATGAGQAGGHVSVRSDYAVRACAVLAVHGGLLKAEVVAAQQHIPAHFLRSILGALRQAGIVHSRRGPDGGYGLARPADRISLADVVRAVDLAAAPGPADAPSAAVLPLPAYDREPARAPQDLDVVWTAVRACVMDLLEHVTVADVASSSLPEAVQQLVSRRHSPGSTRSGVNSAFC
jgi:Rrf2 family protein